ncbi:MAG: nitronate monooxygenase [Coriobacteriales bacterium]|jgi:enoyl-[acyl-carrier protein] reductase II|nr:nitronate monooxygenase [Coriobacteriales bacterium]
MKLLQELVGTRYPLMQGGMAQIATGSFAAAVSAAGGLGVIATGGFSLERIREEIDILRSKTDRPFGVNLMLLHPEVDEIAALITEARVPVVTTGAGNPATYIPSWKAAGSFVIPVIPSVALARRMERMGADAVIAEGTESGGHVGELTTMALVPQVVDAVSIPVIAAGGIASGRQLCAAFALGAIGAQVGTVVLASEESPIHPNYKQMLLDAKDTSTVVTGRSKGAPVRILKNKMAKRYLELEQTAIDRTEMESLTLGSLRKAVLGGEKDAGSFMAGQVAGQLTSIRPLAAIFETIMQEYDAARKELPQL